MKKYALGLGFGCLVALMGAQAIRPSEPTQSAPPSPRVANQPLIQKGTDEIVVAAWNINMDPVGERLAYLVDGIVAMNPDILAVTELTPLSDRKVLEDALAKRGLKYTSTFAEQRERQNIVLFVREGVQVTNVKPIPGSNDGQSDLRMAYSARVKVGNFDSLVVAVHNKSKRVRDGREDTSGIRNRQTAAIWKFVKQEMGSDPDVMIIGDYNMVPGEDDVNFRSLNPEGKLEILSQPSLKNPFTFIFSDGNTSFIDGFAINKGNKHYVRDSFYAVRLDQFFRNTKVWFRQNITDHIPVSAKFKIR
ncbi:MAG TPA: hypothetical protein PLO61_03535 [Fimbriimonadaceae bacterium]|nr:hypothetical protein [Fimbriimonadaceae bacterium]HRJ32702.1 hypothetical protein [Fimbriimonadaceae bacterium]